MQYILLVLSLFVAPAFANNALSEADIREKIVKDSVASYQGICPCPYSTHPDGTQCGYRSAFLKRSSNEVICYEINVTLKMIKEYRAKQDLR
jgi:hypothetical protein